MIFCEEEYPKILDEIALLTDKNLELIFVDSEEMREINREQRKQDKTTDVLTFPYCESYSQLLASIVINKDLAKEKADFYGHKIEDEYALLFIHALLHALGFDHEIDKGEMRAKEEALILTFKLPKSLIFRTENF